jgi:hypothetical protein
MKEKYTPIIKLINRQIEPHRDLSDERIEQEWAQRVHDRHLFDLIRNPELGKVAVIYSVPASLDAIALTGRCIFVETVDDFWVQRGDAHNYQSEPIIEPRWIDIAVLANEMIHTVKDYHHVFLEGVRVKSVDEGGTQIVQFSMGS